QREVALLWIARVVCALASVGTVAVVGVLGARGYSKRVGLAAAALMAVVPLEVLQAHYTSTDPLLTLCVTATLLAAVHLAERDSAPAAILAGALAGLGFSTKYTGLALIVAPGWAVLEIGWRRRSPWRLTQLGLAVAVGFALAFSIGCPQCVLRSDLMLGAM